MALISFSLTTKEFLSGRKTVTRRRWKPRHLEMWQRLWDTRQLEHDAWDKSPRFGGKKIGRFRLTCRPYLERLADMPKSDLVAEGGMVETLGEFILLIGGAPQEIVAVVRLEKLEELDDT
jgi:hypothetical protein